MKKKLFTMLFIALFFIVFFALNCKTTPKKPEDTTTSTTTTTTTTTIQKTAEKLTDSQIDEAKELINKAKSVGAEKFDPGNLKKSQDYLDEAIKLRESNPEEAIKKWELSKKHATDAYNNSLKTRAETKRAEVKKLIEDAEKLGADTYAQEDLKKAKDLFNEGDQFFDKQDYITAYTKYSDSEESLKKIISNINNQNKQYENRIAYIKKLIEEAEKLGASQYSPTELNEAKSFLNKGENEFKELKYNESKESLDVAEKNALSAIEKTKFALKELKRKEALKAIKDAGKTLEDASKIPPPDESKGKKDYKFEFDEAEKQNLNNNPPDDVSQPSTYSELFNKAIDYINKAKQAYKNEDYDMAIYYANIAKKIAESYKDSGIMKTYKVRLIPERRDCLWRISEYKDIYGTPFLWPRIWKANKDIIANPDLIYPGQVLKIPNID
ncbi:MAG TPA: LysM peptidoglycan-binding domain-containing protein [Spirochaetota bacterium]|nr:LysM peptidoglycan-binding domain-containing protein [Spirochaetota bacterium]